MKAFKRTFIIALIIILIWSGSSIYFLYKSTENNGANINFKDNINILLIGIDAIDPNGVNHSRSDVLMLLNINRNKNQISIVSIPRDTRTPIEGRKYKEKINHAYAYGGANLSLKTVNNLFNTEIDHYIVLGYDFVKELIDLMGGVRVDVPIDMVYSDPTADPPLEIDIKQGNQVLDGQKSIGFLRYRAGYPTGDRGRIDAQQAFMAQFVKTLKSPLTIAKLPFIIKLYGEKTQSNLSMKNMMDILGAAIKSAKNPLNATVIPGEPQYINKISYYIHNESETDKLFYNLNN